jgi:hypothetical protein
VHGGGHGAWCWYKTVDLLRLAGHKATAVDLVSCGRDSTDPNHVESFLDYNEPLMELLSNLPDNDKVLSVRRRSSLLHLPPSPNDRSSRPNPLFFFFFFGFVLCVCVFSRARLALTKMLLDNVCFWLLHFPKIYRIMLPDIFVCECLQS